MIAVIFEVEPVEGERDSYLAMAGALKRELEQVDGFLSIERFQSVADPRRMLSLSFWRDETAIETWRRHPPHRQAQRRGKEELFTHYRLRVADVKRDYSLRDRDTGT
ncbi:antibiotic biosynthesis monooxygenase [Microbulbifer sp. SAOS-129_SWC]|uniref:antibiotic biosynthesis monooxygenase family protein n=1 Tax=Microbulbifer sp. SAOS-129_SWC TaxID=3145235 RepID=UPI0032174112